MELMRLNKMKFEKNDLVYIPILGTDIYIIEDIIDNRIVINGSFVEFYTNFHVYEKFKDSKPVVGNFNYRTGYLTNEGKVLIGTSLTTVSEDDEVENAIPLYKGNITSTFVYPVSIKTHWYLEQLTGDKYQEPESPMFVAIKLLKKGLPILCKATNELSYEELSEVTDYKLIVRYDENNNLFYDEKDESYTVVIPVDPNGKEIKEIKK